MLLLRIIGPEPDDSPAREEEKRDDEKRDEPRRVQGIDQNTACCFSEILDHLCNITHGWIDGKDSDDPEIPRAKKVGPLLHST